MNRVEFKTCLREAGYRVSIRDTARSARGGVIEICDICDPERRLLTSVTLLEMDDEVFPFSLCDTDWGDDTIFWLKPFEESAAARGGRA